MVNRSVSILGCGWLGLPLGRDLRQAGFSVKGSTTSRKKLPVLSKGGIQPYHLQFTPESSQQEMADFFNAEVLIIAIPPPGKQEDSDFHLRQFRQITALLRNSPVKRVIYISSTSVYHINNSVVHETAVTRPSQAASKRVAESEALLENKSGRQLTILRCGGLFGYERIPGKYFAGKTVEFSPESKVNYIHRDDVIAVIREIIISGKAIGTFNLVAPFHPTHKAVYLKNAAAFGFDPPVFVNSGPPIFKIVDGSKLSEELNYRYRYADPLGFFYCRP